VRNGVLCLFFRVVGSVSLVFDVKSFLLPSLYFMLCPPRATNMIPFISRPSGFCSTLDALQKSFTTVT